MIEAIRNYLRARTRKRLRSPRETGLVPLGQIRSAVVLIDADDPSFDACKRAVDAFLRDRGIKGQLIYLDLRKIGKQEILTTSITHTILRRDLNGYGRPAAAKLELVREGEPDLLLCLSRRDDFPVECLAAHCPASFKVGRRQLPGPLFDLVVSDGPDTGADQARAFTEMIRFLDTIQ